MKESAKEWLNSDIRADIGRMVEWLKRRKVEILITFGWGVAVASVIIAYYWLLYIEHPEMTQGGSVIVISGVPKWTPRILPLGYVIILITSLIVGALLVDLGKVLFSWIVSFFLSFLIAVFWGFVFVWFVLGVGQSDYVLALGSNASGWIFQIVLLIVFKMIFPIVPVASLLTSFVGAIIRAVIQPSATGA